MARPSTGRPGRSYGRNITLHTDGYVPTHSTAHTEWITIESCAHSLFEQATAAYTDCDYVKARTLYAAAAVMLKDSTARLRSFANDTDANLFDLYLQSAHIGARAAGNMIA